MFKSFLLKLSLALLLLPTLAQAASFTINDPSCAGFVLSGSPPNQVISCAVGGNPPPPPPVIQPPPPPVQGAFNDNQRLWIVAATGHPDIELFGRLGQGYTQGIQDRSTGGRLYDPTIQQQASMASGGNAPPSFTWASHIAAGDGTVVNGVWVWAPKMYPLFLALR